jgi:hypothetical protein
MRFALLLLFPALFVSGQVVSVSGTRFLLDGKAFPYTGISFFNAIYNPEFNAGAAARQEWMRKFQKYGINVFRIWSQWDSKRGFTDTCATCSLYHPDGALRQEHVERFKQIASAAGEMGMVIELVLFSQESWHDDIRVSSGAADRAVAAITRELKPHRNVILQVWNEFDERAVDHIKNIKSIDPERLVTNSPGFAGVLTGMRGEAELVDFFSPHTTRQSGGRHWEIAPREIAYLLARYRKPVVDDEPARNGTPQFGGPKVPTSPIDHILQIWQVWQMGAYIIYHHDMFQMGRGHASVPPSGIPDPEFSPYHRAVLEFIAQRDRFLPALR